MLFQKSDAGAQAAWKGFSSQTLYIASRLILDKNDCEYYSEDVEDLVIRKNGIVVEAVQVKNVSDSLTLSSLASTKTSKGGDGFFNRMCSLHTQNPSFHCIKVVYFNALGAELQEIQKGNDDTKKILVKRLKEKHSLSETEATWLIDSLHFEKASFDDLDRNIRTQIGDYVPAMAAPDLVKELLIQHISALSRKKEYTTLKMWKEKISEIGISIAAIDGFYKEYNKSLICLSELQLCSNQEQLEREFSQGVSAHPTHIRHDLDFKRNYWLEKIQTVIESKGVAIIKGVSGQGKSTLSYRYLIDTYSEGCVFCVRAIATEGQAQNLVAALDGLGKHNKNLIIYIDVQPGETLWAFLLQELQSRGLSIPVLISIRDEDYNLTPISGKTIQYGLVELSLSREEAKQIYDSFTKAQPHFLYRSFEEAWQSFGGHGPLIEFVYLLTNNQTLTQRLQEQIDALMQEGVSDEWLELLQLVCYAGRLGCSVDLCAAKREIQCSTMQAAIRRLKDEYLIRIVDGNKLEALHPVRAQIVFDALCDQTCIGARDIMFKALSCISSRNVRVVLLDYFSHQQYSIEDVQSLSQTKFNDWIGYANVIRSMLWLDAKRYVDCNMLFIRSLIERYGKSWLIFLPLDLSGIERSGELVADGMRNLPIVNKAGLQRTIEEVKKSLTSLSIDYQATNYFINNCTSPVVLPDKDEDRASFGYALFWMAKFGLNITLPFNSDEIVASICAGELQSSSDAIRGLSEHTALSESYQAAVDIMSERIITEMKVLSFSITDDEVSCKFIPPLSVETAIPEDTKNTNHYWRMKMLDILKQIYPNKEYIDIELIGVDLLRDIGIDAMDYKLHIHKDRRPNFWVTELNGWVRTRIDYSLRPSTWNQYVAEIDDIRKSAHELISDTMKLIDDLYKKGRCTKERWKRVEDQIKAFRQHTFAEHLLPQFAVDPYCLYSEGNVKGPNAEYYTMRQLLSVGKYEKFRKSLNDVCTSLDNFYNQFTQVLSARINKQNIDVVDNPRLAMFNLYSAAKTLIEFQQEYSTLFLRYSSLPKSFAEEELECILTLVNVWRYVLDNPPRNSAIAYDARQRYRKGTTYFCDALSKAVMDMDAVLIKGEKHAYILVNYKTDEDNTLGNAYTDIVLKLRETFESSIVPSSDRWYSETQPLELAYVPAFYGIYFPVAYSIPFYKIFDMDVSRIATSMLPCEIEPTLAEKITAGRIQGQWISAMRKLGEIKLYLQRYQQIFQVPVDKKCYCSLTAFIESLVIQINMLWEEFSISKELVTEMLEVADEQNNELLSVVQLLFDCYDEIVSTIKDQNDPSELIQLIEKVFIVMFAAQPFVAGYSAQHDNT